jgi:hypothetical protein
MEVDSESNKAEQDGHVEKGESVILLQEDSAFVKVKTASGKNWLGGVGGTP